MDKDHPVLKRNRGRPRSEANKQVMQRLLDATELLLQDHSHYDLTERKIAAAAEVDVRMIHYYFGDKEGLLFAVIVTYCEDILNKLNALDKIDPMSPSVTRHICKIMIDAYYAKPWLARISISELVQTHSVIRDHFVKKYGSLGLTMVRLQPVFERLIKCGVFSSRVKTAHAMLSMFSIIVAPLVLITQFPVGGGIALDDLKKDDWIDYIADLFDRKFRATDAKEIAS